MDHFLYNASQPDLNNDGHHLFLWKNQLLLTEDGGISGSCSHMTSSLQDRALTCTCGLHC